MSSQQKDTFNGDNWKAFKNTEVGNLLARLYGEKRPSEVKVNYPKPKQKENVASKNKQRWREVNSKEGSRDPRICLFDRKKAHSVKVPSFTNKGEQKFLSAVEYIPRRVKQTVCQENVETNKNLKRHFRPAYTPSFSEESEKCRLSTIFSEKGGKALPNELLYNPKINKSCRDSVYKGAIQQHISEDSPNCKSPRGQLIEQIEREILERREYQIEMEKLGEGSRTRCNVISEIYSRLQRLKKLDSKRANELLNEIEKVH